MTAGDHQIIADILSGWRKFVPKDPADWEPETSALYTDGEKCWRTWRDGRVKAIPGWYFIAVCEGPSSFAIEAPYDGWKPK